MRRCTVPVVVVFRSNALATVSQWRNALWGRIKGRLHPTEGAAWAPTRPIPRLSLAPCWRRCARRPEPGSWYRASTRLSRWQRARSRPELGWLHRVGQAVLTPPRAVCGALQGVFLPVAWLLLGTFWAGHPPQTRFAAPAKSCVLTRCYCRLLPR